VRGSCVLPVALTRALCLTVSWLHGCRTTHAGASRAPCSLSSPLPPAPVYSTRPPSHRRYVSINDCMLSDRLASLVQSEHGLCMICAMICATKRRCAANLTVFAFAGNELLTLLSKSSSSGSCSNRPNLCFDWSGWFPGTDEEPQPNSARDSVFGAMPNSARESVFGASEEHSWPHRWGVSAASELPSENKLSWLCNYCFSELLVVFPMEVQASKA
jgi:hypothetical protein